MTKNISNIAEQWEAAIRCVLWKKLFLEISQNSQENTCARVSFLIKLKAWGHPNDIAKKLDVSSVCVFVFVCVNVCVLV